MFSPTMEVATTTMASRFTVEKRMLAIPKSSNIMTSKRNLKISSPIKASASSSSSSSLTSNILSPGSVSGDFCGQRIRPASLNPSSFTSVSRGGGKRNVITMVIPFVNGSAFEQPPPDLASYLFRERIVYLGMPLVPSVTELLVAEFMYLDYEDEKKPIYFYINSTGTTKNGEKLAYDTEAFAVYDTMRWVQAPIYTLCVGNAWGEASLLLAAGAIGHRAALPSSTIMFKEPIGRVQGQATFIESARQDIKKTKEEMVKLYARHTGQTLEKVAEDIKRPKYFTPSEAVEYGLIDRVTL
ncbi:hypothetical protein AQUCO_05300071v1 [Aquilegia coerulea]|uniref:ATP-dependent Clp protease proteolytic subunit n=1 Tax=Aquilegia coerulea TaxID=218851 RepID=A0A2G5CII3_AQUCA|nr:hypothetical protein AQUCO_05300071v1 [Aquilegia coerulea]